MTELERLAGSVLCVGLPGGEPDAPALAALERLAPGGLVLFARNISSAQGTRALVAAACAAASRDVPPLVAVDQEGGRVARLRAGAAPIPSMMALAATGDLALAELAGEALAADVRRFGANVDFAPVLDLALEAASTVVGVRSFGDDPARVAAFGAAVARGLMTGGVAPVVKHFPGHGASGLDSHHTLPVAFVAETTLEGREYVPFRAAFAAGVPGVMSAHVAFDAFDGALPATVSRRIMTGELRDKLHFQGVAFSDCLEMAALADSLGTAQAAVAALRAGIDCALVSHHLELALEARDAIVAAVGSGSLARERLEEAAARTLALRRRVAQAPAGPPLDGPAIAREIAQRSIAVLRGEIGLDRERPVIVVSFEGALGDGVAAASAPASLSLALRRLRMRSESLRVPLEPDAAMREQLNGLLLAQRTRQFVVVTRRAHLYEAQRAAVDAVLTLAPDAVLVSAMEPFDAACFPRAQRIACTFGDEEPSLEALAQVLTRQAAATGRLPVELALR